MGYLDLKEDGPIVIEVPPGLQGILDDFWQRPIPSVGDIDGRKWSGDVGLPGPDRGNGGKYLIRPPDYTGETPPGYFTYRSGTYGVFVFGRGFFKDPKQLDRTFVEGRPKGKVLPGIYQLDGDELKYCYNTGVRGPKYTVRPKEFKGDLDIAGTFLLVLKREKP